MRIYAQGPDDVMTEADRIVVNIVYDAEKKVRRWKKPFMLDNGACQGKTVSSEELIEITERLKPEIVIAPDVMFDSEATFALHKEFSELASNDIMNRAVAVFRPKPLEFFEHLEQYQKMGYSILGIPSGEGFEQYGQLWDDVKKEGWKIHILGARDGTHELLTKISYDSIDFVCQSASEYIMHRTNILHWSNSLYRWKIWVR